MTLKYDIQNGNVVIPKCEATFSPEGETGGIYLGDTVSATLSTTIEKINIKSSSTPVAVDRVNAVKSVSRQMSITTKDDTDQIRELHLMADATTSTQSTTPVVGETIADAAGGRWYQLGATAENPFGVQNVSSVTVGAGTEGTDYALNLDSGEIYIYADGALAGTDVVVDYTPAAVTRTRFVAHNRGPARGSLKLTPSGSIGTDYPIYIPLCELAPSGDTSFNNEDQERQYAFEVNILEPGDSLGQIELYGVSVAAA